LTVLFRGDTIAAEAAAANIFAKTVNAI